MATLDDLLALLPDNNTGAIDAADLRYIVTELWDYTLNVQTAVNDGAIVAAVAVEDLRARVAALESSAAGGGTQSITGRWQVNPQAGATPGAAQVTSDTGDPDTATWLRFSKTDQANIDLSVPLLKASTVYGQQQGDATSWARFDVTGAPTDGGSYVQVPVQIVDGQGTGAAAWQAAVIVLTWDVA